MDEKYGDGSDHECCPKCGFCKTCGDCDKYGCGYNPDREQCICEGNWRHLVHDYDRFIGSWYKDNHSGKRYKFCGLLHSDDDYYYLMIDEAGKCVLASCVGELTTMGYVLECCDGTD